MRASAGFVQWAAVFYRLLLGFTVFGSAPEIGRCAKERKQLDFWPQYSSSSAVGHTKTNERSASVKRVDEQLAERGDVRNGRTASQASKVSHLALERGRYV